jgi:hypothetical protein
MSSKRRTNVAEVKRIQVSLDQLSYSLLGRIAAIGMDGRSHAEVASKIIREWLKKNAGNTIQDGERLQEIARRGLKIEE